MGNNPERIGKYEVKRALGKGAMGTVYEAYDPIIERRVAIKTILKEYLDAAESEEAISRFKREAQAGGRLNHPCIVGVYEYGEDENGAFIVMEYVEGKELRSYFRMGNRFDLIDVFELMKQLLAALDYSHRQGVVHRDIKPANLMILDGRKLKVMDFGIARITSSSLTQVGTVVGTPTHMSPEQLMGLPADGRADIWSAGVILYELLTGVSPFMADTPATVMHKVLQGLPDPPSVMIPSLPGAFDAVVGRALQKKPEDRYPTAREFAAALLAAFQGKARQAMAQRGDTAAERTLSPSDAARVESTRGASATRAPKAELTLPPETIAEVERSLSRHIGPLAKILMSQAREQTAAPEEFFRILADNIEDDDERKAFLDKVSSLKKGEPPPPAAEVSRTQAPERRKDVTIMPTFTPETLAVAEKALASYVGPLARILIKEAAEKSGNLRDLYGQLAAHIDEEDERKEFLARFRK